MKPILRWVGGKRRMLKHIIPILPKFEHYHEPFVGCGAVFFDLERKCSHINDKDERLIRFYRTIANHFKEVMVRLKELEKTTDKEFYLELRKKGFSDGNVDFAAKYLYFNKLSFSGVMRFNNKTGKFNVPYGNPSTKQIFNGPEFLEKAKLLQSAKIFNLDFPKYCEEILAMYSNDLKGHLFYLDPPYLSTAANYSLLFTCEDMTDVATWCDDLYECGASIVISNNDEGADYFKGYKRIDKEFLYSVNPKHVKGIKKNEVILMKSYGFKTQLSKGKQGEKIFNNVLIQRGYALESSAEYNKTKDMKHGIDITAYKEGRVVTFQVKTENYDSTKNLGIEVWSKIEDCVMGGHVTTEADYIAHVMNDNVIFLLKPSVLKLHLATSLRDFPVREIQQKCGNYTTGIIAVPVQLLKKLNCIHCELDY